MERKDLCPICKSLASKYQEDNAGNFIVDCERCSKYKITDDALTYLENNYKKLSIPAISYCIRNTQSETIKLIFMEDIKRISATVKLPKVTEQANNFILWLGNIGETPGEEVIVGYNEITSIIGASNIQNAEYILKYLYNVGYVHTSFSSSKEFQGYLTYNGWHRYEELLRSNEESNTAFMAMEYGDPRLDSLYKDTLRDAVKDTGFELRRLDEKPKAGVIDNLMRVEIRKSKFLIADLTTDNRGAYWEAGYAEGLGKEVIYICEESKFKEMHFDTNHCQTVPFSWDDPEKFAIQLKATIRATFPIDAKMEDDVEK